MTHASARAERATVFWGAFALFAALGVLWALASPIFSVPDESAHVVKAVGQVRGEVVGHRVPGVRQLVVDLPPSYAFTSQTMCFVFHPEKPADCGSEVGAANGTLWSSTWVSTYNPIYYYVVGWPSLFIGGPAGIYAMRILSALLGALFFGWAVQTAMSSVRARWMPVALSFAALPMIVYLNGAVNPNGLEIVAGLALTTSVLRLLEGYDPGRFAAPALGRRYLWAVAAVSAVILADARALGPLWVVLIIALCVVACGWRSLMNLFRDRGAYPWLALIAAGGLFSVGWTLIGGSLSGQAEKADAPLVGAGFVQGFVYMARETPNIVTQALGYFGWFDAPLPGWAYWPVVAAILLLLTLALAVSRRRGVATLVLALAIALLAPILIQAYGVRQTGIIWQGRYGLVLYVAVFVVAGWLLSNSWSPSSTILVSRVSWVVYALLWSFGGLAFVLVLRRYVIGNATPIGGMFKAPQWEPPMGWIALVLLYLLVSALFFVFLAAVARPREAAALGALHDENLVGVR